MRNKDKNIKIVFTKNNGKLELFSYKKLNNLTNIFKNSLKSNQKNEDTFSRKSTFI